MRRGRLTFLIDFENGSFGECFGSMDARTKPWMSTPKKKRPGYCTELALRPPQTFENNHEDVNGEKLTVKKWWIFGADFSRFTQSFSRFVRDINGEKKHLVVDDLFHS